MRSFDCLYFRKGDFANALVSSGISPLEIRSVEVYTADLSEDEALECVHDIAQYVPDAPITGMSCDGFFYNCEPCPKGTLIHVIASKSCTALSSVFENISGRQIHALATDLAANGFGQGSSYVSCMTAGFTSNCELVEELNEHCPDITIFGGVALRHGRQGDAYFSESFVFDRSGAYHDAIILTAFCGEKLQAQTACAVGFDLIGETYTITKSEGTVIAEVNGTESRQWFARMMEIDSEGISGARLQKVMSRFPAVVQDVCGGQSLGLPITLGPDGRPCVPGVMLKDNLKFRVGFFSPERSEQDLCGLADALEVQPAESLFAMCCVWRRDVFSDDNDSHKTALLGFRSNHLSGPYVGGEFSHISTGNIFQTGSLAVLELAESERYIASIDRRCFHRKPISDPDIIRICNTILKKESDSAFRNQQKLLRQIIEQENMLSETLFVERNTEHWNIEKFLYDNEGQKFNKLCLISVERSIQISHYIGRENYIAFLRKTLSEITDFLSQERLDASLRLYVSDLNSFFIVANDQMTQEDFMNAMRMMFVKFNKISIKDNIVCFCSFYLVLNDTDLLENARLVMNDPKNSLKRFVIFEKGEEENSRFEDSMSALAAVSWAIEHDGVEPFFQPIYDNVAGCTHKFESLMRIRDQNGRLWFPNQFLPVSKEFRLYSPISCAMINKVFDLFENRKESVSINLSAIDISAPEVVRMIFDRIEKLKHPENFIFEILESEGFSDQNILTGFIQKVREHHVKLAIDDFGSGYSNLLEIIKMRPDIIKIDGEIIKNLLNDPMNRQLMDVIIYMSNVFNVDLVAEYAESEELQTFLMSKGIRYSQGYYFSKPIPYDQIDAYLESEKKMKISLEAAGKVRKTEEEARAKYLGTGTGGKASEGASGAGAQGAGNAGAGKDGADGVVIPDINVSAAEFLRSMRLAAGKAPEGGAAPRAAAGGTAGSSAEGKAPAAGEAPAAGK